MDLIVSQIVDLLARRGGYRAVRAPLRVAEIDFCFDAVLVGPKQGDGLVVIVDLQAATSSTTARRIRGLVNVLDRLESRRTVSVILVIRAVFPFALEEIEQFCHVVIVRPDGLLESSLRPLLPLVLPIPEANSLSAEVTLRKELDCAANEHFISQLIGASQSAESAIRDVLRRAIDDAVDSLEGRVND